MRRADRPRLHGMATLLRSVALFLMLASAPAMAQALSAGSTPATPEQGASTAPPTATLPLPDGQIAKIGFLEAFPSWKHRLTMRAFESALGKRGWWDRVELARDATFTSQKQYEAAVLWENARLLMQRDDLVAVIALGTAAAQALREHNNGRTAILALDIINPLQAGLIETDWDSGVDNFTLIHMSQGWNDMFHLFHEFVSFRRLGAMFIDTENGPISSKLREIARDGGFQVEIFRDLGEAASFEDCESGISTLVKRGIDAFLVPPLPCFDPQDPRSFELIGQLVEQRVATFAPEGASLVKYGALFGQSSLASQHTGEMAADMLIKILQGALPRSLPMTFDRVPSIAVNLDTATRLGIDLSLELMGWPIRSISLAAPIRKSHRRSRARGRNEKPQPPPRKHARLPDRQPDVFP
jgi:ABC-type uncharacterized transport system substrate-binding protein